MKGFNWFCYQAIDISEYWFITNVNKIIQGQGKILKYQAVIIFNEWHITEISFSQFIILLIAACTFVKEVKMPGF